MDGYNDKIDCMLDVFILLAFWKLAEIIVWIFSHIYISIN